MKELRAKIGGRPFANDDFMTLQAEVYDAIGATLAGAPAMVLSGCDVFVYPAGNRGDIAAGFLWLAGDIHRYPGAHNVALPAEIVAGDIVETDLRAYQTGGSQACMQELALVTQADGTAPAGTERVRFLSAPTRTYSKWVESKTRALGDLQDSVVGTAGLCDPDGLGFPDGPRAGWGLANGKGGRADLSDKFRVAVGPTYPAPGRTGGAAQITLSLEQMPAHNHTNGDYMYLVKLGKDSINADTDFSATEPTLTSAGKMQPAGGNQPFDNRPPFYSVVVWQYVGLS
jgi:hypothetical protein